jgi:hypothetical protein
MEIIIGESLKKSGKMLLNKKEYALLILKMP